MAAMVHLLTHDQLALKISTFHNIGLLNRASFGKRTVDPKPNWPLSSYIMNHRGHTFCGSDYFMIALPGICRYGYPVRAVHGRGESGYSHMEALLDKMANVDTRKFSNQLSITLNQSELVSEGVVCPYCEINGPIANITGYSLSATNECGECYGTGVHQGAVKIGSMYFRIKYLLYLMQYLPNIRFHPWTDLTQSGLDAIEFTFDINAKIGFGVLMRTAAEDRACRK